jgi:hypothetical protein
MSTHLPSQNEQQSANVTNAEEEPQASIPSQPSASQPIVLSHQSEEEEAFYFEEEQPDLAAAFVAPFQLSGAMPTMPAQSSAMHTTTAPAPSLDQSSAIPPAPAASPTKTKRKTRLSLTMIAILVCVVVIVGLFVMNALGQTTPPLQTRGNGSPQTTQQTPQKPTGNQQQSTVKPTPAPAAAQTNGTNGQGQATGQAASDWVPQQLPNGWTNAGLLPGDGIQAIRTAVAFNDREMSLDYRSVGTRNNHGGTFTAATFVMTAAARQRFQQNDVRESSNALFDTVVNNKQIRLVVNPQPQLVKFAQAGQQQFAWVDVAFQLWQSQIDPNNPQQRIDGKELDPATNQPLVHHMMVLLLRVPPQNAGNNPAMGGTGWLVSNYALDLPNGTALDIVQPA